MKLFLVTTALFLFFSLHALPVIPSWNGKMVQYEKSEEKVPSGRIFVRLKDSVSIEALIADYPLILSRSLTVMPNVVILDAHSGDSAINISRELSQDRRVVHVEPVWKHSLEYKRALPDDDYMDLAWHLYDDVLGGDASVVTAWDFLDSHDIKPGAGIVVGIIDDGFDIGHEDLFENFARGYDFETGDEYPFANDHTPHGTAVSGVLAARGWNGKGVVGGAPYATIIPVRMNNLNLDGASEVEAFDFLLHKNVDIISNSWGPMDNAGPVDMPGPLKDLIEWAAVHGRDGKGTIVLFAAGNGNESISDKDSFDGYAAHPDTIAVGAVNRNGLRTLYSDFGKDLDIVAPSCDIDTDAYYDSHVTYKYKDGIPTTDVQGILGYRMGDYAPLFCGTSAATPLAASIVALILSANYDLSLDSVRDIIHLTADKVSPQDARYDENEFSPFYGYGRINALKAVERACEEGCVLADNGDDLERYSRDELPPPVDYNGKVTTMTDEDSIIPPELDGCSMLFLP